jgi:hypothetical protein
LHPQLSATEHYHGFIDYNKTAFGPPDCKIIAHEKQSQRRTWAAQGQPGWSLGPAMQHYRCQNVYITATANERIVDTLDFFPHNSPMPQMSSTDRILMAAQDTTDDLNHPHPDVTFATIGDNTISALAILAEFFTRKFKKAEDQNIQPAPQKAAANKQPATKAQPISRSPITQKNQTRSQTNVGQALENVQQPPRVVTPAPRSAAPPRVPTSAPIISAKPFPRSFGHRWR